MGRIRLTVAVPTFNGFKTLGETLGSIVSEISSLDRPAVNLEIFDNGSTGPSEEFLNSLSLPAGSIIHRAAQNLGYDENIKRAVQNSQGDFVKIIADDDLLVPGTLKSILDIIDSHKEISFVVSDFSKYSSDMLTELEAPILDAEIPSLQKGESGLSFVRGRFGQVSSLTFRRALFTDAVARPGLGTNYIHVYAVYALALHHAFIIQLGSNVLVREGSPNFSDNAERIVSTPLDGLGAMRDLKAMGYSRKFTRATYKSQANYLFGIFLFGKLHGTEGLIKKVSRAIGVLGPRPALILSLLACLIPLPVFRVIAKLPRPKHD